MEGEHKKGVSERKGIEYRIQVYECLRLKNILKEKAYIAKIIESCDKVDEEIAL